MPSSAAHVQYRLPCKCGQTVLVDRSQAGILVRCACGAEIEVPTIRGLHRLETVQVGPPPSGGWGNRQAVFVMGITLAAIGFGLGAFWQLWPPRPPITAAELERQLAATREAIERAPVAETLRFWDELQKGLDSGESPAFTQYRARLADNRRWVIVMTAVGVAGLVLAGCGFLLPPTSR